jgi:PRC-barrel domain
MFSGSVLAVVISPFCLVVLIGAGPADRRAAKPIGTEGGWMSEFTAQTVELVATDAEPESGTRGFVEIRDLHGLLGKEVRSASGEKMGRVVNILVDGTGGVRAAVIDFGGFLGVGVRKVAIDWSALKFAPHGSYERIVVDFTRDQIKNVPEYKDGDPVAVVGASDKAPRTQ